MMLKRFLIAAVIFAAACQSAPTRTTLIDPIATSTSVPPATRGSRPAAPQWFETQMNGVSLGMWRPSGWGMDRSHGLIIAEPTDTTNGMMSNGLVIYCFVPPADEFYINVSDANYAWTVLDQVVRMPSHTGYDVTIGKPLGFDWDDFPAAYYLLTSGDGMRVLVLAVVVPNMQKLVVCNLSAPASQSSRIRAEMPHLLDGMSINGKIFSGKSLDTLPDPLEFPHYSMASTQVDNRMPPDAPP